MNLDDKITSAINELQSVILAEKYLISIQKKIKEQNEVIQVLGKRVEEEYKDIEKIESASRKILFKNILGFDAKQLEIERQEYLHAVLMYKDAIESIKPLNFEEEILLNKTDNRKIYEENLERLLVIRERELLKSGAKKSSQLLNIYREIDSLEKFSREIFEAKDIGLKCKRDIAEIVVLFEKAIKLRKWGQIEGEEPSHKIENGLVDVAVNKFQKLKVGLLKFEEELEDVHESRIMHLETKSIKFDLFIDAYNNYLINDWVVRKKLSSTLALMEALMDDVVRLLNTLEQKKMVNTKQIDDKEKLKFQLLNIT